MLDKSASAHSFRLFDKQKRLEAWTWAKISMDLPFCQAEKGFSLDELVGKMANVFERKAFPELLRLILQMTQEILLYRIFQEQTGAMQCCTEGHLRLNGSFKRRIRTSLGDFKIPIARVRCSHCGKTFAPLQRFLQMKRGQTARFSDDFC